MGIFSTVLHLYKSSQSDTIIELTRELKETYNFSNFKRIDFNNNNYENVLENDVFKNSGIYYLITEQFGNWTTIVELNVNIENPFYLYELTNNLSAKLNTYALSFHLHDGDVLFYNLDYKGNSLDGYNSNYQYFLDEPADKNEVHSQRHLPDNFKDILPVNKTVSGLNTILNEGYWNAFDNNDLDEFGVPNQEKYFIDEEDRYCRIGNYLEINKETGYPFADWYSDLKKLDLTNFYLLKAE